MAPGAGPIPSDRVQFPGSWVRVAWGSLRRGASYFDVYKRKRIPTGPSFLFRRSRADAVDEAYFDWIGSNPGQVDPSNGGNRMGWPFRIGNSRAAGLGG